MSPEYEAKMLRTLIEWHMSAVVRAKTVREMQTHSIAERLARMRLEEIESK